MLLLCNYIEKRKRKRQAVVSFLVKHTDPLQESIALCPDYHSWVLSQKPLPSGCGLQHRPGNGGGMNIHFSIA